MSIFQNIDKEPFVEHQGTWKACGGELTSQSSAPVQLFFDAGSAGQRSARPVADERQADDRPGADRITVRAKPLTSEEPDTRLSRPILPAPLPTTLLDSRGLCKTRAPLGAGCRYSRRRCCSASPCWQLVDSSLPPRMMLVEIEVVVVAAVMLEITIRLRRAARVSASIAALVQGLTSVGLCTLVLGLSAPTPDAPGAAHRARLRRGAAHRRPVGSRAGALDHPRWRPAPGLPRSGGGAG